jgi:hypothetical protein
MLTPAHRRTLETIADPERRAGLRRDEREAVRAALDALDRAVAACVEGRPHRMAGEGYSVPQTVWYWRVGPQSGHEPTRALAEAAVRRAMGWEVPSP